MTEAWLHAPKGKAAGIAASVGQMLPVLETARLRLRAPVIGDYPAYRDVFTSDRAAHMGGPFTQDDDFADFCQGIAGWMLRGAGMWTVTRHGDNAPLGWIYLWREFGDPEDELGWVLTTAAEGHGYASEAARAVLPHAVALFGADGFVSYIAAENHASARIAVALGAARDAKAEAHMLALGEEDLHVYRHSGKGTPL